MQFKRAQDNSNLVFRHTSGSIELGFFPTIYGVRVRAGYINSATCNIDWCCGDQAEVIRFLFNKCLAILSLSEEANAFKDVPSHSNIKPAIFDKDFLKIIESLPQKNLNLLVPTIYEIRAQWEKHYDIEF